MAAQEIIHKTDELYPNQFTEEQKLPWLSALDGDLYDSVIRSHDGADMICFPEGGYDTDECELIVGPPYGEDLYTQYLLSRMALANGEVSRYQLMMSAVKGTEISVYVRYDSDRVWRYQGHALSSGIRTVTLAVRSKCCNHLEIRLSDLRDSANERSRRIIDKVLRELK